MVKIELFTKGFVTLIDDEDFDRIKKFRWCLRRHKKNRLQYACATIGGNPILLHRFILGASPGKLIDHANGDGLDNRRQNLRFCTPSQNLINACRRIGRSGFRGVQKRNECKTLPYCARIGVNGQRIEGPFRKTAEEAAKDYEKLCAEYYGDFKRLNFGQHRDGDAA